MQWGRNLNGGTNQEAIAKVQVGDTGVSGESEGPFDARDTSKVEPTGFVGRLSMCLGKKGGQEVTPSPYVVGKMELPSETGKVEKE